MAEANRLADEGTGGQVIPLPIPPKDGPPSDPSKYLRELDLRKRALLRVKPWERGDAAEWNSWSDAVVVARSFPNILGAEWQPIATLDFTRAKFARPALFGGFRFPGATSFDGVSFKQGADFSHASFFGPVSFQSPTGSSHDGGDDGEVTDDADVASGNNFGKSANFSGVKFFASANFFRANFNPRAKFDGATFSEDAIFERTKFWHGCSFSKATFKGAARFGRAQFAHSGKVLDIDFSGAVFEQGAWFADAEFRGSRIGLATAHFAGALFKGATYFDGCSFGEPVTDGMPWKCRADFSNAKFHGALSFSKTNVVGDLLFSKTTEVQSDAFFEGAEFLGHFTAAGVTFDGAVASFDAAKFLTVDFRESHFTGRASFRAARATRAMFEKATFAGAADFTKVQLLDDASFVGAEFEKYVLFEAASCAGAVDFENVKFQDDVTFLNASFIRRVHFKRATFGREKHRTDGNCRATTVTFTGAHFSDFVHFDRAIFESDLDFSRVRSAGVVVLEHARFAGGIPKFTGTKFLSPPQIGAVVWEPAGAGPLVKSIARGAPVEGRRELAARLRTLAALAAQDGDKTWQREFSEFAQDVDPDRPFGSKVLTFVIRRIMGRGGSVWRPLLLLLFFSLMIFPMIYLFANYPNAKLGQSSWWPQVSCTEGMSGNSIVAAYYISLKSTLFGISDTDERAKQVTQCLYGINAEMLATSWLAFVPFVQSILSGILLFAIGFAVRNRLRAE